MKKYIIIIFIGIREFFLNLVGNRKEGAYIFSGKKLLFILSGALGILAPWIILKFYPELKISANDILNYYQVIIPSLAVTYAGGKIIDNLPVQ